MSYSPAETRRRLPRLLLVLGLSLGLCLALPCRRLLSPGWILAWTPLFFLLGHGLLALSQALVGRSFRRGMGLLRSTPLAYTSEASATHLVAALTLAGAEELLFRGALLQGSVDLGLSPAAALPLSAALFAAAHARLGFGPGRWRHYLDLLLLGGILGAVTLAFASLYPALALHWSRNYVLRCLLVSRQEYQARHRPPPPANYNAEEPHTPRAGRPRPNSSSAADVHSHHAASPVPTSALGHSFDET